jgi:hypothetical protein
MEETKGVKDEELSVYELMEKRANILETLLIEMRESRDEYRKLCDTQKEIIKLVDDKVLRYKTQYEE